MSSQVETLLAIESDNPGNENKQKRALFKTWLTQSSDVTWGRLLEALGRVDHTLRDQVRDTYNDDDVDDDGPLHGVSDSHHAHMPFLQCALYSAPLNSGVFWRSRTEHMCYVWLCITYILEVLECLNCAVVCIHFINSTCTM